MLHVKAKRVNPMSSCHKGNIFVVNAVCIWGDGCSLNLLRQSFHDLCKPECYTVHLKLIQCYMSIVSIKLEGKKQPLLLLFTAALFSWGRSITHPLSMQTLFRCKARTRILHAQVRHSSYLSSHLPRAHTVPIHNPVGHISCCHFKTLLWHL